MTAKLWKSVLLVLGIHLVGMSLARASQAYTPVCRDLTLASAALRYCVQSTEGAQVDSSRIVYVFHGIFGDADFVNTRGPVVQLGQALRQRFGAEAPLIIGLSTGPQGILKNNARDVLAALPQIEQALGSSGQVSRHIVGFSMGGHNSSRLVAESPAQFASVSLICPALLPIDPFDQAQLAAYRARHKAYLNVTFFNAVVRVFEREFPDRATWDANNPFQFLSQGRFDTQTFFVSVGQQDGLGFNEGSAEWKTRSILRNIAVQNKDVSGNHCSFDSKAWQDFMIAQLRDPLAQN